MPHDQSADAAALRAAVTALSSRMASDFGDLVPAANAERTAALLAKLERPEGAGGAGAVPHLEDADIETLDSWIRLADSFVLHGDPEELRVREAVGQRLRAVRERIRPDATLSDDPREEPREMPREMPRDAAASRGVAGPG
jgi:hypothetical protein